MPFPRILIALGLSVAAASAGAQCVEPSEPTIPDGLSATMPEMLEAQKAVKAYQAEAETYRACLSDIGSSKAHNKSVEKEEALAAAFNAAIRKFRAANSG